MLSSKKIVVTVALTLVACLSFSNASFAKDQKSPMMSGKTKMGSAPKSLCASTSAYAHKEPQIQPPTVKLPVKNRTFTLDTNCGQIVIEADGADAPLTVLVMTALAKGGYFNKTLCHRLTTNGLYVLQCGDPTASGKGGPLFTYDDENLPQAVANNYPAGTVAMANSGLTQTGHGTNGSQFFLVYADTTLGANYTRWGTIVKGLDILKAVAAQGVLGGGTDGTPKQAVGIEKVSVK
ncbi:MAG: peptidylprolyl isomerase [Actinomycetes bacterium]|jgi:peptidyl-prolyl cis-trans isomerase B (cyclophilin B)